MPKSLALGNGNMLLLMDYKGQVRDFYFPYVGLENQAGGRFIHRIGVYTDNQLKWFDDHTWDNQVKSETETLASDITAINRELQVNMKFEDVVYNEKNIFIRKVTITNACDRRRTIKVFFNQEFEIYESHRGDTAYYDPKHECIIHYKGRRVLLINAQANGKGFQEYSVGLFGIEGKEGTHKDAEDGVLTGNSIEHGLVDSVIGLSFDLDKQETQTFYYWVIASKHLSETYEINDYVLNKTPGHLIKTTEDFWHAWVNKQSFSFYGLDHSTIDLFKKSLLVMRTHADNHGSILASGDSDMLQLGRDTYGYMWPRDGAYAAKALDKAGDYTVTKRFFEFCNDVLTEEGYLLHKYRPDRSVGSSWHPWIRNGVPQLPIQEDETALVIHTLWSHYEMTRDLEFIEDIYNSLIKKSAEFMSSYIDETTYLPKPSYDLWEEKFGISTYTTSTVYAGLIAASKFANILGKVEQEQKYNTVAERMRRAIIKYLYNEEDGSFYKMINIHEGQITYDKTLDASSIYAIYRFGILHLEDPKIIKAIKLVEERLWVKTAIGGVVRYEGDKYYRDSYDVPGNPWIITTLWLTQYYISIAKTEKDLEIVRKHFEWVVKYASLSGLLSEQIHPHTGKQISTSPLTWSHSEFVITVIEYLEKLEELGVSKVCYVLDQKRV